MGNLSRRHTPTDRGYPPKSRRHHAQRRSRAASWSFYAGIGAFALFVVLPPLVDLVGIAVAIIGVIVAALVLGAVFFKRF
jgi:Na+/melibiose symporter-like transporter